MNTTSAIWDGDLGRRFGTAIWAKVRVRFRVEVRFGVRVRELVGRV